MGVIVWQIFSAAKTTPFNASTQQETFEKILAGVYEMPANIPDVARDLITKLLVKDPTQRLGANNIQDLLEHAFFEGVDFSNLWSEKTSAPLLPRQKRLTA